jgi:hypothetical protein
MSSPHFEVPHVRAATMEGLVLGHRFNVVGRVIGIQRAGAAWTIQG